MNLIEEVKAVLGSGITPSVSIVANNAPHSFEFGPAGSRFKVYYSDKADLGVKIREALEAEAYYRSLLPSAGVKA